jgi:hypothetical protein
LVPEGIRSYRGLRLGGVADEVFRTRDFKLDEVYSFERHLANFIPATRTSNPKLASSFNICVIADLLISSRAAITVCDLGAARHGLVSKFL